MAGFLRSRAKSGLQAFKWPIAGSHYKLIKTEAMRFKLEQSKERPGWWVYTDTVNEIVMRFKEHDFNGTQEVTHLREMTDYMAAARIMREMGDWIGRYHRDIVF